MVPTGTQGTGALMGMRRLGSGGDRGPLLTLMCHGDPDRCYTVRGRPLPLCARCIAFYPLFLISALISFPLFLLVTLKAFVMTIIFILMVLPLVIDGYSQYIGLRRSNNPLRTITGGSAGIGCGLALAYLVSRFIS
jgi:uncharacterized membrane protein